MATFGDLLGLARKSSFRFAEWLKVAEPSLADKVAEAAAAANLTPAGYVRVAVADFSRFADEEEWATLSSTLKDSEDPGLACLLSMIHWRLTRQCCERHRTVGEAQGIQE
jgi:hypothetical protein